MTRIEKTLLVATGILLVCGLATWGLLAATGGGPRGGPVTAPPQVPEVVTGPSGTRVVPSEAGGMGAGPGDPTLPAPLASGGGIPTGLRAPSGEDLSKPERVLELLRLHLAVENPRWDYVTQLLHVFEGTLPSDIRWALQNNLVAGNAAGAIQGYEAVRDPTVAPELLRLLDDPKVDDHDRANVLIALSTLKGKDPAVVVTGIESRLDGSFDHDRAYLEAIARTGSAEATRALIAAIQSSSDPSRFERMLFRELDIRKDPASSELLAAALSDPKASPGALRAIADLAGRPGASPAVVDALKKLDADATDRLVRIQAMTSLARTGDDAAYAHLLDVAQKGADYASVAARALSEAETATPAARERLLDTAKKTADDNLRVHLIEALGNLREPQAVPFLTETLEKGSNLARREAAAALGKIGPAAESSVEAFGRVWGTVEEGDRTTIAIALGSIGTPEARKLLQQLLASETSARVKRTLQVTVNALESRSQK